GAGAEYEIEDRALAHLKIAIMAKLRLQENFLVSWNLSAADGSGRVSIWISPSVPLQFRFSESEPPDLNKLWLQALARSSHSSRGMILIPEEDVEGYLANASAAKR
ncbi:MAG: hypothetical protein ABI400_04290, partial [Lacisediminihabitans sp.]